MPSITGVEIEILTIMKWIVLLFIALLIYKVLGTWAGEFANRIMYKGILSRRKDNEKDSNGKSWFDRFLEHQEKQTEAVIALTEKLSSMDSALKSINGTLEKFECKYKTT